MSPTPGELVLLSSSFCLSDEDSLSPKPTAHSPILGTSYPCLQLPGSSLWSSLPPLHPRQPPFSLLPFPSLGLWRWLRLDADLLLALSSFIQLGPSPVDSTPSVSLRSVSPFGIFCSLLLPASRLAFKQAQLSRVVATTGKRNPRKLGSRTCQNVSRALRAPCSFLSPGLYDHWHNSRAPQLRF